MKKFVLVFGVLAITIFLLSFFYFPQNEASAVEDWKLVFGEDVTSSFSSGTLKTAGGKWECEDGYLVCKEGGYLFFNKKLPECQKIEIEITTDAPGDLSPVLHTDGEKFISGYLLQFGGCNNTVNKSRRLGKPVAYDDKNMVVMGKLHKVVAEFDGEYLHLFVDGKKITEYREVLDPLVGNGHEYAGIYIYKRAKIKSVHVYTRPYVKKTHNRLVKKTVPVDGENLLEGGDAEDYNQFVKWDGIIKYNTSDSHSGKASYEFSGEGLGHSSNYIPIDYYKTYEISGWFKSLTPEQLPRVLYDIRYYTEDKRPITPNSIAPVTSTSTLAKAAEEGDKTIYIKAKDWKEHPLASTLVFNAKEDLSDLPSFDFHPFKSVKLNESGYEVELKKPLGSDYPAGTGVRLHRYLDHPRVVLNPVPTEWTRCSKRISAKVQNGGRQQDKFWPGAKFMKVTIIHQYRKYPKKLPAGEEPPGMLMDDLELKVVK